MPTNSIGYGTVNVALNMPSQERAILDRLRDYRETAKATGIPIGTLRDMVATRVISPAMERGTLVRFHVPTVLAQACPQIRSRRKL